MSKIWWWDGTYQDVINYTRNCLQCVIITGSGRKQLPSMHSIPVDRPFQIVRVDIMKLPVTAEGNCYVMAFQDFFTSGQWYILLGSNWRLYSQIEAQIYYLASGCKMYVSYLVSKS